MPPQLRVLGFVHHAHAARPEFTNDLVMQQRLTDERIGRRKLVHSRTFIVGRRRGCVKLGGVLERRSCPRVSATRRTSFREDYRCTVSAPRCFRSSSKNISSLNE